MARLVVGVLAILSFLGCARDVALEMRNTRVPILLGPVQRLGDQGDGRSLSVCRFDDSAVSQLFVLVVASGGGDSASTLHTSDTNFLEERASWSTRGVPGRFVQLRTIEATSSLHYSAVVLLDRLTFDVHGEVQEVIKADQREVLGDQVSMGDVAECGDPE